MPVCVICLFDEDSIKNEANIIFLIICLRKTKGQLNSLICPKIKFVQDFMAVLNTGNADEDLRNQKWNCYHLAYISLSPAYMRPIRVGNSHANIRNWIKMEQDFMRIMPVLIVCMFDEDLIKNDYRPDKIFPIICLWETKWQAPYSTSLLHHALRFFKITEKSCGKISIHLYSFTLERARQRTYVMMLVAYAMFLCVCVFFLFFFFCFFLVFFIKA